MQRKSQDKSLMCPYFNLLFTLFPPVHLHIIVPVTWIDVYLTDRNLLYTNILFRCENCMFEVTWDECFFLHIPDYARHSL